jgi:uncharacterized protein (TIGR00255 family)
MTGYGDARNEDERLNVAVEVRTVNNRYLKIATKIPDAYAGLESRIEKVVRESISRGTVSVTVRIQRLDGGYQYALNREVIDGYWKQLIQIALTLEAPGPTDLSRLLLLPGAVSEEGEGVLDSEAGWPVIRDALQSALEKLQRFRCDEGRSMEDDLRLNGRKIGEQLDQVAKLAPQVVSDFRDRLRERVNELLKGADVTVSDSDLIREVSVYSERCDINEEITRLRCHLDQFEAFLKDAVSQGRKLEFLSQEMFREVNTIGSKANNVEIAHCVVEMKAAVEKIRENLQNVE